MKYKLCIYDLWGNSKDGYEVNHTFYTDIVIDIKETDSDYAINRKLKVRGAIWEGDMPYPLYARSNNGKPLYELIPLEGVK